MPAKVGCCCCGGGGWRRGGERPLQHWMQLRDELLLQRPHSVHVHVSAVNLWDIAVAACFAATTFSAAAFAAAAF